MKPSAFTSSRASGQVVAQNVSLIAPGYFSPIRAAALDKLQSTYGNRAVQRYIRYQTAPKPVQRDPENDSGGGVWDFTKKLLGVDQIGTGVKKVTETVKSGYNSAEKKVFDFLRKQFGDAQPNPDQTYAGNNHETVNPYLQMSLENTFISGYQL